MDNILHSLVGAAIADRILPATATRRSRRLAFGLGVVAASAPDADFLYYGITAEPLGFLLHHRGHTHSIGGVVVMGAFLTVAARLFPSERTDAALGWTRLFTIGVLAALSHVLIDVSNVFGAPFWYPFSSRWFFGDTSFIVEPWLWAILAVPLALNARSVILRSLTLLVAIGATLMATDAGILPKSVAIAIAVFAMAYGAALWGRTPGVRTTTALASTAMAFAMLAALSSITKARVIGDVARSTPSAAVLDVVLEPDPGLPWCWSVLTAERHEVEGIELLSARRGTVSLLEQVWPATHCTSFRTYRDDRMPIEPGRVAWTARWEVDAGALRSLDERDCWARAWFQFGRAPMLIDGTLRDLRLENKLHGNFTALSLDQAREGCPTNTTNWYPPRADVLGRSR